MLDGAGVRAHVEDVRRIHDACFPDDVDDEDAQAQAATPTTRSGTDSPRATTRTTCCGSCSWTPGIPTLAPRIPTPRPGGASKTRPGREPLAKARRIESKRKTKKIAASSASRRRLGTA